MQGLYFNENLFAILVQTGIWLPSLILFIVTVLSIPKAKGRIRKIHISFALFSLMIALTYISWTIRAIFYSKSALPNEWFIFWQLAYSFGVLSFYFLIIWSINLINPELLEVRKYLYGVLLIPWLIVLVDVFVLNTVDSVVTNNQVITFANINDIRPDVILTIFATLAVLFYTLVPIYNFYRYLRADENKGTTNYRKIFIIEIGLVLFLLGSLIDASKPPINELLYVSRFFMGSGIIIGFIGLKLPKRFHVNA